MFFSYFPTAFVFILWISSGRTEKSSSGITAVYLGCYTDSGQERLMRGLQQNFPQTLTPEVCNKFCFENGFAFAGTQYSRECFCSKTRPPNKKKSPDSECNAKCDGDQSKVCGGTYRLSVHSTGAEEITIPANSYLGCYIDGGHGNRIMNSLQQNFPNSLTPDVCFALCLEKGFSYAGTQYRIECFCSNAKPSDSKKSDDSQCNMQCAGDDSRTCGGNNRISVHSTGIKPVSSILATPDNYLGCYIDGGHGNRIMNGHQQNFPDSLTPDVCFALCLDKGFSYSGTQYRVECFCSNLKPSDAKKSDDHQCNMKCAGDDSRTCGGNNRISVHSTGIKPVSSGLATSANYVGCYIDGGLGKRIMNGFQQNFPNTLTPDICFSLCLEKGFSYAGTQYRIECFCSKTKPVESKKSDDSECNMKCAGDDSKYCGGNHRLSVHRTGINEDTPDIQDLKYVGCFRDYTNGTRLMTGFRQDFPDTLTNELCSKICKRRGFKYAGMQYGKECFCDNKIPSYKNYASDEDCDMRCDGNNLQLCGGFWRISIFHTGISGSLAESNAGKYIGCYKDLDNPRHLKGFFKDFRSGLTAMKCTGLCYSMGFLYSGTQNSKECYCGDEHPNPNLIADEKECSKPCSGDPTTMCGGSYRNSIRETGITDYPAHEKYLGCFNDINNQIFKASKTTYEKTNSPRRCFNICWQLGFRYSGVEYGKECFCGNEAPSSNLAVSGGECNMVCSGDVLETCGASWRMAVYSINLDSSVQSVTVMPTTTTAPVLTTTKTCQESETSVNGKKVCKGEIIFSDEFKTPLGDKWKHVIVIPESPDNDFIILHDDPKNCFITKNYLVIKPTLFSDDIVEHGSLQLKGCTGVLGTRECGYQSFSFNILPPVASARVNTRHSFTFRYGIVEIRAKLPIGDWLVPEIWLEQKDHLTREDYYQSGRIRMAMCRGNEQLTCGGEDLSSRSLESGIMMGIDTDVRRRSVLSTLPANWHDYFHTYTLIWKPDSISFKIDNDIQQELVPKDKTLCEAIGFDSEQCALWGSESKIAPFNNEFYISLGVSSGNSRDFPDDCLNRGKQKPWRNWEVKAMLRFWRDKQNWVSTWTDDKSALSVEYVRVTAL